MKSTDRVRYAERALLVVIRVAAILPLLIASPWPWRAEFLACIWLFFCFDVYAAVKEEVK